MEIILLHQTFTIGDAIGHDIEGMYSALEKQSKAVFIYSEYNDVKSPYKILSYNELKRKIKIKENLLIYHHSIYWAQGETIINEAKCEILMKYHNITPSHFFEGYSSKYRQVTLQGQEQTKRFVQKHNFNWLSDSLYNGNELIELGLKSEQLSLVPPFHKIEYLENIDHDIDLLKNLENNNRINVLFVGRVIMNKGHLKICEVAKAYKELYGEKITFWIVGGFDSEISRYYAELNEYIYRWKLEDIVIFTQKISMGSLKSYFMGSNVFLCLSEHEGFCVPLIESQYHELPIVTWDRTAIKETMGENQIVYSDYDAELMAASIHHIYKNKEISSFLIENGKNNYNNRFKNEILEKQFIDSVNCFLELE